MTKSIIIGSGFSAFICKIFFKKNIEILGIKDFDFYEKNFLLKRKKRILEYNYYARKNIKYKTNLNNFFKKMKRNNLKINKVKLKYGNSISVSIKQLHKISFKMLKKDPFIIVK